MAILAVNNKNKLVAGPCEVCQRPDREKPMVFRGERWCSDDCRKILGCGPKDGYNGRTA